MLQARQHPEMGIYRDILAILDLHPPALRLANNHRNFHNLGVLLLLQKKTETEISHSGCDHFDSNDSLRLVCNFSRFHSQRFFRPKKCETKSEKAALFALFVVHHCLFDFQIFSESSHDFFV